MLPLFHVAVAALLAPPSAAPYQVARMAIQSSSVEQGIPNPRVHAVLLDSHNQLWVGTQEGIARLGSNGWISCPMPPEIAGTQVRALAEDRDGALWVGTQEQGLWRFHRGIWQCITAPDCRINALLVIASGSQEVLWVATAGSGLLCIEDGRVRRIPEIKDDWVWALASIPVGRDRNELWVGGDQTLSRLRNGQWSALEVSHQPWKGRANALALAHTPDGHPEVLASVWQVGLCRWDPLTGTFKGLDPGFPSRTPTSLLVTRTPQGREEVCVGTYDQGLQRRTPGGWQALGPDQGLASSCIYTLVAPPGGRPLLWAGTRDAGLVSVDPAGWRAIGHRERMPGESATCFLEAQGAFWIGTDRGLVRWDTRGPRTEGPAQGLPSPTLSALAWLPGPNGGELWAGTLHGLARRKGGRWEVVQPSQSEPLQRVHALAVEPDHQDGPTLWVGTENGLWRHAQNRWTLTGPRDGLPSRMVSALLPTVDAMGGRSLWVGTRGGGLARFQGGRWTPFSTREGLPGKSIYGLAESRSPNGRRWLWVAMAGGRGLARLCLDHPEQGFQTWPELMERLPSGTLHRVEVVNQRELILTSPQGVARLPLEGPEGVPGAPTTYHTENGLPSAASNPGASYQDQEGRIWVGTAHGAAVLDLDPDAPPPPPTRPFLEQILVNGDARPVDAPLVLHHREASLAFSWVLPVFQHQEDVRYRTQLLGLEAQPGPWSRTTSREFTTLPPRDYCLRIWARDAHGRLCGPLDLPFRVKPAPWATPWARAGQGLLLLGLATLILRLRTRLLRRRAEELAHLVSERTQALEAANDALLRQSLTDPLTGLGNRRYLETTIQEHLARVRRHQIAPGDHGHDLALFLLDLDHFKLINDRHGHAVGDQVLQQTAERLRAIVRPTDRVVRWGGEEFLLVVEDLEAEEALQLAERVRLLIGSHPFEVGGAQPLKVTASLGFATIPLVGRLLEAFGWEQVLSLADQCLYEAKAMGRDGWVGLLPGSAQPDPGEELPVHGDALVARNWVRRVASRQFP